jgi:hypothetical protein
MLDLYQKSRRSGKLENYKCSQVSVGRQRVLALALETRQKQLGRLPSILAYLGYTAFRIQGLFRG